MLHNPRNSELVVMQRGKHGRYSMLPFHGEEWLRGFGLDDMMIQDQKWQQNAKLYDLNECVPCPTGVGWCGAQGLDAKGEPLAGETRLPKLT